jgi:hypothetical protein
MYVHRYMPDDVVKNVAVHVEFFLCMYVDRYVRNRIYTYMYVCVCAYTCTRMCICTHMYMYMCVYRYMHTHVSLCVSAVARIYSFHTMLKHTGALYIHVYTA